jgi:hypothetical protein
LAIDTFLEVPKLLYSSFSASSRPPWREEAEKEGTKRKVRAVE